MEREEKGAEVERGKDKMAVLCSGSAAARSSRVQCVTEVTAMSKVFSGHSSSHLLVEKLVKFQ